MRNRVWRLTRTYLVKGTERLHVHPDVRLHVHPDVSSRSAYTKELRASKARNQDHNSQLNQCSTSSVEHLLWCKLPQHSETKSWSA